MYNLEETRKFLQDYCMKKCNHNPNVNCICKVALCFKELENFPTPKEKYFIIYIKQFAFEYKKVVVFKKPIKTKNLYEWVGVYYLNSIEKIESIFFVQITEKEYKETEPKTFIEGFEVK